MNLPVVLAEPHPAARAALAALLAEDDRLDVFPTSELGDALRAVARFGSPLLIVSRRLLERGSAGMRLPAPLPAGTRTIVMGLEDGSAFTLDARRAGAAAYVVKDRAYPELRKEIDALLADPALRMSLPLSALASGV
jgi:DNA-binding NarL/FixJ family response regulator